MMFAAGFGTRMKELTKDRPKPLIPVAGKPLVDHALDLVRGAGATHIVANLHYKAEMLQAHLELLGVTTTIERPDILETGGGLRAALPILGTDPVATLNTDAIWDGPNPLKMLQDAWNPDSMDALLTCISLDHAVGHTGSGDFFLGPDGRLERGPGHIYGGIQIIKTDLLAEIKETKFSLNMVWNEMEKQGRLFGLNYPGRWCDVGHPGGIPLAEAMLGNQDV